MTYTKLIFIYCKEGVTFDEFFSTYEHTQMPFLRNVAGKDFPSLHKRGYVHAPDIPNPPDKKTLPYDCVAELTFEDRAHVERYFAVLRTNRERLSEIEKTFMDTAKTTSVDLGSVQETRAVA